MHDWTLINIILNWLTNTVEIELKDSSSKTVFIKVLSPSLVNIPRKEEWGESISVNEYVGPTKLKNGSFRLEIEMQTGDNIVIEAAKIEMPGNN